ncbi:ABC transporter substrate-binding protein [Halobellus salinus]|uniref:ABC transporter substrate-binding protein n=1 Tax=Halobellus salinus TaxID=931585 RepID=A0A830EE76_9EURY|nr:extracellular solute-binding protein [Halobellus salinus]GGJ17374.1 ABC transporter substrate-binding protein [Halobellus salinus]
MREHNSDADSRSNVGRRQFLASAGVASAVAFAGCSGGSGGSSGSDGGDSTSSDSSGGTTQQSSVPPKPESITVRAWGGAWQDNLDEYISKPFTEETGIPVEYDNSNEDEMQAKIRTAIRQDRTPPVDVQWSLTKTSFQSLQMDLMTPLDTEIAPNITALLGAGKPETDGAEWPFVNFYSYTYALTYNTDRVDSEPTSWSSWWEGDWENDIGLYTAGHGVTPVIAKMTDTELGAVDTMEPVWEQYRDLKPHVGAIGDDSALTQNLRQGEVAMSVMLPANIVNAQDDGAPVDYTIPEEGARAGRDTMWIPKNLDDSHTYWGQKYINTAASGENIGPWCQNLGVAPLHPDAEIPGWMVDDVAFPTNEEQFSQMITPSLDVLTEHEPNWESRVNEIMGG